MRTLIFICCCFTVSLRAQSAATSGVFSLLLTKPFVAEVTSSTSGAGSFKLSLRTVDGQVSTFETTSTNPSLEQKFVAQLKSGSRYAFPGCLVDFLGLEETVVMVRSVARAPGFTPFRPTTHSSVLDLGQAHPFRAMVLDQGLGENGYSIVLQGADSRLYHASGTYSTEMVKRIAEGLQRGETYEFPAALDGALLSDDERAAKARPKSAVVAVLGRYIGAWSGTLEEDPKAQIQMNCHWLADGSGIWREVMFNRQVGGYPPMPDIARVTFDGGSKSYIIADPAAESSTALTSQWDEGTRTFTTTLPAAANGQIRVNRATFTAEDRIDWNTETRGAGGKVQGTKRGSYVRTSKSVPAIQLPPQSKTTTVTFTSNDGRAFTSQSVTSTDFFKLREVPPFRGRLTLLQINAQSIKATLEGVDLRQYAIHHVRDENWDKALVIAKRLTPGPAMHEFPAALADDYEPPPAGFVAEPSTDAMRALAPFIGHWRMHWTAGPGKDRKDEITIHYFWSNDGTGLWREVHLPAGMSTGRPAQTFGKARVEAVLTTYDAAARRYIETSTSSSDPNGPGQEVEWDAKTQTYSMKTAADASSSGIKRSSTRRVVSPDRIEFHSTAIKADGSVLQEGGGYYERIEP